MSSDHVRTELGAGKNKQTSLEEEAAKQKTIMDTFLERYPGQPWIVSGLTRGGGQFEYSDELVAALHVGLTEIIKSIATAKPKRTDTTKPDPASEE